MKLCERVVGRRLGSELTFRYGFLPGKSTTDALFDGEAQRRSEGATLRVCAQAYDKVRREEVWHCMIKYGVLEKHARILTTVGDVCK